MKLGRRRFIGCCGAGMAAARRGVLAGFGMMNTVEGTVIGEPTAAREGVRILQEGGNVVDAIVGAALTAAVASPSNCGMGGYGMVATFALDGGRRVVCIDGNSTAPALMSEDVFRPDAKGHVPGNRNDTGWLAAGVPGTLAGLELALRQFGTRSLSYVMEPAIRLASEGIQLGSGALGMIQRDAIFRSDEGSRQLYFPDESAVVAGMPFRNPWLAEMLKTLAAAESVDSFYRGQIAEQIAEAFRKNGGLVTRDDLAAYSARIVDPLRVPIAGCEVATVPLTSGGLTVLQILKCLEVLRWNEKADETVGTRLLLESARLAWRDRLSLLGDAEYSPMPTDRLLSDAYAGECAEQIERAVSEQRLLSHHLPVPRNQTGTIHLSAVDASGNMAALTLTHGNGFGACVTVRDLGLTLGHGMSRFDPVPGHPNGPGPGKRPLHNMVPTVILRDDKAFVAAGGTGGRKIPNSMLTVLAETVLRGRSLKEATAAPRFHTEGGHQVSVTAGWPATQRAELSASGYRLTTAAAARVAAVSVTADGIAQFHS